MKNKKNIFALFFIACFFALPNLFAITKEEIITLSKLGIGEDEIIKAIEKDRTVFDLKIQDILELKKSGVAEKVIKFMLQTPQKFGTVKKEEVKKEEVIEEKVKTPEEIKAEEERAKEEARRIAEEAKKAQEARRKAYARGIMKRGEMLANDGKYVEAIELFQNFLKEGNYGPETEEYYNSKFGMAIALTKAGLLQSAAKFFLEILLDGSEKPFFQSAFYELRNIRKIIIYSPPDLEELTKFFIGNFSRKFQDSYYYMLGEFFYDYGNFQKALKYFDNVSPQSAEKSKALYLTGLIQVQHKMFKSAVESFQQAILLGEKTASEEEVLNLSYLALARVAYESGNYDGAIFYYRKIPKTSRKLSDAFYESAWAYLMRGDYSRSLGTFHALHSPYFSKYFFPELWIMEATVYLNLCKYELAKESLKMFDKNVTVLSEPLKRFMKEIATPEDYFKAFLDVVNGKRKDLPQSLTLPVLSNVDFYNLYKTIQQIRKEKEEIASKLDRLGEFGKSILEKLNTIEKDRINECGIRIQKTLKELDGDIMEWQVKVTEIEVDIDTVAIEKITEETKALFGEEEKVSAKAKKEGAIAIVGGDTERWPFEGDYWLDEINYFRSFLKDECVR